MFSYVSELRLVRLKSTEGGIYTFEASNGDAAVKQNFSVFVISKWKVFSPFEPQHENAFLHAALKFGSWRKRNWPLGIVI